MNTHSALALSLVVLLMGCGKQQAKPRAQRPDEGLHVPAGAPRCTFRLNPLPDSNTRTQLEATVKGFALSHNFRECPVPFYEEYRGPGYPVLLYKDQKYAILVRSFHEAFAAYHMAAYSTNYDRREFDALTNGLAAAIQEAFPGRLEVNPANWALSQDPVK